MEILWEISAFRGNTLLKRNQTKQDCRLCSNPRKNESTPFIRFITLSGMKLILSLISFASGKVVGGGRVIIPTFIGRFLRPSDDIVPEWVEKFYTSQFELKILEKQK